MQFNKVVLVYLLSLIGLSIFLFAASCGDDDDDGDTIVVPGDDDADDDGADDDDGDDDDVDDDATDDDTADDDTADDDTADDDTTDDDTADDDTADDDTADDDTTDDDTTDDDTTDDDTSVDNCDEATPPGCSEMAGRYTANPNGTITDNCLDVYWWGSVITNYSTWTEANAYAESATQAGITDWRLMYRSEAESLVLNHAPISGLWSLNDVWTGCECSDPDDAYRLEGIFAPGTVECVVKSSDQFIVLVAPIN